jgi:predicted AAA+ superfamily ATPase
MEISPETPEFYTGSPVDAADLRYRDQFVADLWDTLRTKHVLLTAPRRTGKTSVMDHLRSFPQNGYAVIYENVQENDFYVCEVSDGLYDFASGILKAWWKKYYA